MMQHPFSIDLPGFEAVVKMASGKAPAQPAVRIRRLLALSAAALMAIPMLTLAAGEIDSVTTSIEPSTPFRYSLGGIEYTWGVSGNQVLESFSYNGNTYPYRLAADNVIVRRVDRPGVATGQPCAVFAERERDYTRLKPDYPRDAAAGVQCDVARLLKDRVLNRGALNVFTNTGPEPKNIERVDFVFPRSIVAPITTEALASAGHIATEKRGNNRIQMAAITALDAGGNPSAYGPLVMIHELAGCSGQNVCYGETQVAHEYSFFRTNAIGGAGDAFHIGDSSESLAMAFVSLDRLGISAGQAYYGFSYFARDVDESRHSLTDPATFPADTADDYIKLGDGADIYGGAAGYFLPTSSASTSTLFGTVFADSNGNGVNDPGEAGIENVSLSLFTDTNQNGVLDAADQLAGPAVVTDASGEFAIGGVPDGLHFLQLDETDPDLPPGATIAEDANPIPVTAPISGDSNFDFAVALPFDDGIGPTANNDTVILNQDEPTIIDVLANDVDNSGTGLTIVDVTGVENGTVVTNADGTLTFTPAPGFTGETGFLYIVEDANGEQSTGMVTATVVPFSDINNNELNDFVECGCTDLGLITGIHGAGAGRSGSLLLILVVWAGFRLRRTVGRIGEAS